jgi:adenylosuccinate lyase
MPFNKSSKPYKLSAYIADSPISENGRGRTIKAVSLPLSALTALSPLDGRYASKADALRPVFSEYGLIEKRLLVEIRWLIALANYPDITDIPFISESAEQYLQQLIDNFNEESANRVKAIEETTRHDVKALEYFLKEKLEAHKELKFLTEFIHFGCTSEDINNLAYALMLKDARDKHLLPQLDSVIKALTQLAHQYADLPMLARTHGQTATPTTLGKEMGVFVARLARQRKQLAELRILAKFNGAVGNFNAHRVVYPEIDWPSMAQQFVEQLGLQYNSHTTQIESHDYIAEFCDVIARINTILVDFSRDTWGYISLGYFKQKTIAGEIGSSTMPHKVNPIDFENAEGNLGLANAMLQFLSSRLPVSRWQRDLVDSTLLRNLGVAVGHTFVAWQTLLQGIQKIDVDPIIINADLEKNWVVLAEAIQTVMRRYGLEKPYEALKELTRGKIVDKQRIHEFIGSLKLPEAEKQHLYLLTPQTYLGYAVELAKKI